MAINDIDMNMFLKLMITELQQQDPLNPLDNKDMLNQIAQIRAVGASDQLTKTLNSVLLGQNITSATNLLGADISALTDNGEAITGIVNRVAIDKGVPKLHVENAPGTAPSVAEGEIEAGTYSYRVVWDGDDDKLWAWIFPVPRRSQTTGTERVDRGDSSSRPAGYGRAEVCLPHRQDAARENTNSLASSRTAKWARLSTTWRTPIATNTDVDAIVPTSGHDDHANTISRCSNVSAIRPPAY